MAFNFKSLSRENSRLSWTQNVCWKLDKMMMMIMTTTIGRVVSCELVEIYGKEYIYSTWKITIIEKYECINKSISIRLDFNVSNHIPTTQHHIHIYIKHTIHRLNGSADGFSLSPYFYFYFHFFLFNGKIMKWNKIKK
jgi:hypothetical protein